MKWPQYRGVIISEVKVQEFIVDAIGVVVVVDMFVSLCSAKWSKKPFVWKDQSESRDLLSTYSGGNTFIRVRHQLHVSSSFAIHLFYVYPLVLK